MNKEKRHIVLVHGAFHTGECWNLLIPELEMYGLKPHTLTLPGHEDANQSAISITLSKYVDQVIKVIESIREPVILLGHSMGGIIITMVADRRPKLINQLIYLTANVPRQKDRMIYMGKQLKEQGRSIFLDALKLPFKLLIKGRLGFDPDIAAQAFYHEHTLEEQQGFLSNTVPQPIRPYIGLITWSYDNLRDINKAYIECALDQALLITHQRVNQKNMTFDNVKTLESNHSPFYLMPEKLAEVVSEIVASN